jgi:hypothetical protein
MRYMVGVVIAAMTLAACTDTPAECVGRSWPLPGCDGDVSLMAERVPVCVDESGSACSDAAPICSEDGAMRCIGFDREDAPGHRAVCLTHEENDRRLRECAAD